MPNWLIHDGNLLEANSILFTAHNRAFRYGDGLFETMKIVNGSIMLKELHFDRLFTSLQLLQFNIPAGFTPKYIENYVLQLCQKNNTNHLARIRLTIYRSDGGLYFPENNELHFVIQSWPLSPAILQLNEEGFQVGIFYDAIKSADKFSCIKSNNCLPYVMAAVYARQQKFDEVILCNHAGNIADATIANIFIVKDSRIFTPPLSAGCINGVMRKYLLHTKFDFDISEKDISEKDLLEADELFFTNVISGIRWADSFLSKKYTNIMATSLHRQLTLLWK